MTNWFDTHAHVADSQFDADRKDVIARSFAAGVSHFVEIGEGPDEWEKSRKLAELYDSNVWWTVGLHPYYADQLNDDLFQRIEGYLTHPRLVGIGEVGLDYAKSAVPKEIQRAAFSRLIRLALAKDKPLVIHCREAYQDLIPLLKSELEGGISGIPVSSRTDPLGVIHCFSGDAAEARELAAMGFYLGIDGPITYPSAKGLREAIAEIPLEKIVLETDCPYLPPQSYRGKRNEPAYIPQIGGALADLRHLPPEEVARVTAQNGFRLYRLKHSGNPTQSV